MKMMKMMKTDILLAICLTACSDINHPNNNFVLKNKSLKICTSTRELNCHVDDYTCYTYKIQTIQCK